MSRYVAGAAFVAGVADELRAMNTVAGSSAAGLEVYGTTRKPGMKWVRA